MQTSDLLTQIGSRNSCGACLKAQ